MCEAATSKERAYGLLSIGNVDENHEFCNNSDRKIFLGSYNGSSEDILAEFNAHERDAWKKDGSPTHPDCGNSASGEDLRNACLAWAACFARRIDLKFDEEGETFLKTFENDRKQMGLKKATDKATKYAEEIFSANKKGAMPGNGDPSKLETAIKNKGLNYGTLKSLQSTENVFSAKTNDKALPECLDQTKPKRHSKKVQLESDTTKATKDAENGFCTTEMERTTPATADTTTAMKPRPRRSPLS